MDYQILSKDEQDDIKVSFLLSQERDKFCHEQNKERYAAMLETLEDGDFKARIAKLYAETVSRLVEVNSIIAASLQKIPTQERIDAAVARLQTARTSR